MILEFNGRQIDGIAFDLEGTIINLEKLHHTAHAEVALKTCKLKIDIKNPSVFFDIPHMIGGPDVTIMEEIVKLAQKRKLLKNKVPDIEEMLELDGKIYHNLLNSLDESFFKPRNGFENFFHLIKNYGIPSAIGTLTSAKDTFLLLAKSGLYEHFKNFNIVTSDNVLHTKPDPEVYRATAGILKISPYRQLVFEDSHNGIKAAHDAGSASVAIPVYFDEKLIKRLKEAGADEVYSEWTDLTLNQTLRLGNSD